MVLVAAIAASVIVQTSENLQQRAYSVGKETIRDVSSGIRVIGMTGKANSAKTRIEYLAIAIKPRAGSLDLDINETLVYIQYENLSVLSFDTTEVTSTVSADGVFSTLNMDNLSATEFGVIATHDSDGSTVNNYGINSEDQAILIVNLSAVIPTDSGLPTGKEVNVRIVPEFGSSGIYVIKSPNTFRYTIVEL